MWPFTKIKRLKIDNRLLKTEIKTIKISFNSLLNKYKAEIKKLNVKIALLEINNDFIKPPKQKKYPPKAPQKKTLSKKHSGKKNYPKKRKRTSINYVHQNTKIPNITIIPPDMYYCWVNPDGAAAKTINIFKKD